MNEAGTFGWKFQLILLLFIVCWAFVQVRYLLRRYRSYRWPTIAATIQKGAVGTISFGKGVSYPASFFGYIYLIQGVHYAGFLALYGEKDLVGKLNENLAGETIQVRYGPSDPGSSFLVEYNDSRFRGLTATQNPKWLGQAPAFDLQDAIHGVAVGKSLREE